MDLIRESLTSKHWLLDPDTAYMKCWECVVLLALVYTAFVAPFEVAFLSGSLGSIFYLNRVIDVVFAKDMVLQFFLKIEVSRDNGHGMVTIRQPSKIRAHYLRTWFFIDVISMVPIDIVILLL